MPASSALGPLPGLTAATATLGAQLPSIPAQQVTTLTAAMIAAVGEATSGDIKILTLPAKHYIKSLHLVIDTPAAGTDVSTVTGTFGRAAADYVDYFPACNLMAAANTLYGNAETTLGAKLTGKDVVSYTAATDFYTHVVMTSAGATNLSDVTNFVGRFIVEIGQIP